MQKIYAVVWWVMVAKRDKSNCVNTDTGALESM